MIAEVRRGHGAVLAWGRELREELSRCLALPRPEPMPVELLARFLAACTWLPVRDGLLVALDRHRDEAIGLLSDAVRRSPRAWVAGPATLLGLLASLQGEGALANVAFDVALDAEPGYRFAVMLSEGLARGVRMPDDMIRKMADPLRAGG
jgi:hypothetical protein